MKTEILIDWTTNSAIISTRGASTEITETITAKGPESLVAALALRAGEHAVISLTHP